MKHVCIFCYGVLVASMLGCQVQETDLEVSKRQSSYVRDDVVNASVSDLSTIITSLSEDLGITIQESVEGLERYVIHGVSLSNRVITIEVEALVKGKSHVRVTVQGDEKIARYLNGEITHRLRTAVHEYSRN